MTQRPANENRIVILLADDNPLDVMIFNRTMRKGGIRNEIRVVQDGEDVLDYVFRRGGFESPADAPEAGLIIMDMNMPRMDGIDVLEQLKANPESAVIPVLMLSGSIREEDVERIQALGGVTLVRKPIELSRFLDVVTSIEGIGLYIGYETDFG